MFLVRGIYVRGRIARSGEGLSTPLYSSMAAPVMLRIRLQLKRAAAFETMPHELLLSVLPSRGVGPVLYRWISNFLAGRSSRVGWCLVASWNPYHWLTARDSPGKSPLFPVCRLRHEYIRGPRLLLHLRG